MPERRVLFISHATPQDNAFATWLATQLAIAGYEVWCDVTKLLGGERFWKDIEEAIDQHSFRVLFASTLESNRKQGTLHELQLALETQQKRQIKDFVVPLKVDKFPYEATDKHIKDLNFVRFDESWSVGLSQLLELFEREGAPKSPHAGPACVTAWHQRQQDQTRKSFVRDETCYSNWFPIKLPAKLFLHRFSGLTDYQDAAIAAVPFPCRRHESGVLTFAPLDAIAAHTRDVGGTPSTIELDTEKFIREGNAGLQIASHDAANMVTDIVQKAWNATLPTHGLTSKELASGYSAWFFADGKLDKNRARYVASGGRAAYRQVVGRKSKKTIDGDRVSDGFWHYAISGSPQLQGLARIVIHHHVIFTDDGATPWASAERMHKARRSVCKNWWNDAWRDRLFAMCSVLGGDAKTLPLPVGPDQAIDVAMNGLTFVSPRSFFEGNDTGLDEAIEIVLVEDADDGEEGVDDEAA